MPGGPARASSLGTATDHPTVWRRLELPSDLSLDVVHEVLQIAFAWHGYHLHQFETACGAFGSPDGDGDWGYTPMSQWGLDE